MTDSIQLDDTCPQPQSAAVRELLASTPTKELFINGGYQAAASGAVLETLDPATGKTIAHIANAGQADIDAAVLAARTALTGPWAQMTPLERSMILLKVADLIDQNMDELCELEILDQGKPWFVARWAEIPAAANQFRFFAGQAMALEGQTLTPSVNYQPPGKQVQAWTVREPVGVVAAITPWNSPLILTAMKLAPALAAGCTVVHKPAELTSLTALRLAELMTEAGLPAGVLNVVTGEGRQTGAMLAAHTGVDKIAFTGSTATGRAIVDASKSNLKRVSLELGGKSPALVLDDAELDITIPGVANGIFFNGGQVCVANSRAYIHRSIFDKVIEGIAGYAAGLKLGHGLNQETQLGPVVSQLQAEKIESYIQSAKQSGATIVTGGERLGSFGTFIQPTIITGTNNKMPVHCEEVFGPVLVAEPFDDINDALKWANDSDYGLAGSIWTQNLSSAQRLSRQLEAGTVWINTHSMFDPSMTIGGMKQSGYGRDSGKQALDNYLEWKTICAVI
ncbi:aldehyde dehydrogenase family protein [Halioxenophilus sp. WMMB6]|uniref:aldehyde dehydrogenase family protein n=1 Tax=Halioxenophilus sp. WMMB6 TaxID=3073815 RepID=UPI00295EACD4|nr:aldehyde dehydrogenase family protein [Halioxenophilus sp. WMMB6]